MPQCSWKRAKSLGLLFRHAGGRGARPIQFGGFHLRGGHDGGGGPVRQAIVDGDFV